MRLLLFLQWRVVLPKNSHALSNLLDQLGLHIPCLLYFLGLHWLTSRILIRGVNWSCTLPKGDSLNRFLKGVTEFRIFKYLLDLEDGRQGRVFLGCLVVQHLEQLLLLFLISKVAGMRTGNTIGCVLGLSGDDHSGDGVDYLRNGSWTQSEGLIG